MFGSIKSVVFVKVKKKMTLLLRKAYQTFSIATLTKLATNADTNDFNVKKSNMIKNDIFISFKIK